MNWMFESRSKDYQYDEDVEGGSYVPSIKWYEALLFPFIVLPVAILFAISEVLCAFAVFAYSFYEIARNTAESGKLESPGLILTGIGIAILLPTLISNNLFYVSDHPISALCASLFVIFFTLAPLTGLVWRLFKQKRAFLNHREGSS